MLLVINNKKRKVRSQWWIVKAHASRCVTDEYSSSNGVAVATITSHPGPSVGNRIDPSMIIVIVSFSAGLNSKTILY
jgi:hypothetical protein